MDAKPVGSKTRLDGRGDNAVKLDKLAKIAHDLRTPLSSLKMALSLLEARRRRAGEVAPQDDALISTMQRNVVRLEGIANDLSAVADEGLSTREDVRK